MTPPRKSGVLWAFYLVVTLLSALPLGAAYWWLSEELTQNEIARHQERMNSQLNLWQEQLYDLKWDSLADTADDALHLGHYDEAALLRETLMWYVYPDGRTFIEGTAILDPDGGLRPSKQAAVIDDAGRKLPAETLARLKKTRPWLESPWLPDYSFVTKAFKEDHEREFLVSPFIKAPGRLVYLISTAKRNDQGDLVAAVVHQLSVLDLHANIIQPGAANQDVWLLDRNGVAGLAVTEMAAESARRFLEDGLLTKALAEGAAAAEAGQYGAKGSLRQQLPLGRAVLYYRTQGDSFVLGVVESEAELARVGQATLRSFGAIALCSLLVVVIAGAVYTIAAVKRERAMVEKDTLRRFAGTLSHKVRNHLSALRGAHEILLARDLPDAGKAARRISEQAEPAVDGIQDAVEDLERLSQGDLEVVYDGQAGEGTMFRLSRQSEGSDQS